MAEKDLLGHRLRKARENLRYSQKDAAARLGIHNSTLGKYELGEREPDIETINKIAKFYDVTPQWLIFGDKEEETETKKEMAARFTDYIDRDFTNETIIKLMQSNFKVDGMLLSVEEINEFIDWVRVTRAMKKLQQTAGKAKEL